MNPFRTAIRLVSIVAFLGLTPVRADFEVDDIHWFYDYGGPSVEPFVFEIMGQYLYAGGAFLRVDNDSTGKNLARFDLETEEWSPIPGLTPVLNGVVRALHAGDDGWLYIGGNFSSPAGTSASRIFRYNPANDEFEALTDTNYTLTSTGQENGPTNGDVRSLLKIGTKLYVGGFYTGPSGSPGNEKYIRQYDLTARTWSRMGNGLGDRVFAMVELPDGSLLAGGAFDDALARWNGTSWTAYEGGVGTPTLGVVRDIEVTPGGRVYVGGDFLQVGSGAGQIATSFVAYHDPATGWNNMGGGFDDKYIQSNGTDFNAEGVYDLDMDSAGNLYAGGDFQANPSRSEVNLDHVALWDGTGSWKPLGSGVGTTGSQNINCIAVGPNQDLYVGGTFSEGYRNASSANTQVARWDRELDFTGYVPGAAENPSMALTSITTNIELMFRTRTGTEYQVQGANSLPGSWSAISGSTFTGNGDYMLRSIPLGGQDLRLLRIEAVR